MPLRRKLLDRLGIRPKSPVPKTDVPATPSSKQELPQPIAPAKSQNDAFDRAFNSFVDELTDEDRQLFLKANSGVVVDDLFARIAQIDSQDKNTTTRRGFATISRFLRLLDQLVNGVAIGAQASPEISSLVVGGAKLVIDVAVNFVNFFEKLTIMIERLSDHIGHLGEFSKHKDQELLTQSVTHVYSGLLRFYHHAYGVFKNLENGQTRTHLHLRAGLEAQWKPFEEKFGTIDSDIKHHLNVLEHSANALTFSAVVDLKKSGEEELAIRERKELLQWLEAADFDDVQASMLSKRWPGTGNWVFDQDNFKKWLDKLDKNHLLWCNGGPGTGKSVLTSVIIDHLHQQLPSRSAGTVLVYAYFSYQDITDKATEGTVASLTQQLIRTQDTFPDTFVNTFRDHRHQNKKPTLDTMTAMFCEAAKQISEVFVVIDALDEYPETERERLFSQFISPVLQNVASAKVLVTSRPEMGIADYLRGLSAREIKIGAQSTKEDIRSYVIGQLDISTQPGKGASGRIQKTLRVQDPQVRKAIIEALSEESDGMFLWVDLQLNQIFRQRNEDDIIEVLKSLPKGLNDTYFRILKQIENEARPLLNLVVKCLMWTVYSRTRLRLYDLRDAIAMDESITDITQLQRARQRYTFADILDTCRGMVVAEDKYPDRDRISGWSLVKLIHFSLWQFIMTDNRVAQTNFTVLDDAEAVECNLARMCINHLMHICLKEGQASSFEEVRIRLAGANTPFAWYCAKFFDDHAVTAGVTGSLKITLDDLLSSDTETLAALIQLRHMRKPNRRGDLQIVAPGVNARTVIETSRLVEIESIRTDSRWATLDLHPESLHQACANGEVDQVKHLIDLGVDFTLPNQSGQTPFKIAINRMRLEVAHLLLQAGDDVDQCFSRNETALELACSAGYDALVTLLLDAGATGCEADHTYATALFDAIWSGHGTVAHIILSRGAICTENTLLHAATVGLLGVVQAALRSGVNPNGQVYKPPASKKHRNNDSRPLYIAAKWGFTDVVKVLLEYGADASLIGGSFGIPLQAAALGGREEIVKLLLDHGGSTFINHTTGEYGTALAAAAYNGQGSVVQLLLDAGADVNISGGPLGNALTASVGINIVNPKTSNRSWMSTSHGLGDTGPKMEIHRGTTNVTEKLIMAGADIKLQGPAALREATKNGHIELVDLLLYHGAEFDLHDITNIGHETPASVVRLLLQNGADANLLDHGGCSPLIKAINSGKLDVVEVLVAGGADTNLPAKSHSDSMIVRRPLHEACTDGKLPIVRLLLENNADPNLMGYTMESSRRRGGYSSGSAQGSALHAVCSGGCNTMTHKRDETNKERVEILSLLLEKGAKACAVNENGWTALEQVCSRYSQDPVAYPMAKLLIDAGVDIQAPCGGVSSALEAAAKHGYKDIVELLLSKGITDDHLTQNALQVACDERQEAIATLLIDNGVDISVPLGDGEFIPENDKPIHSAVRNGSYSMTQKLLDAGADMHARGFFGTAYETALAGHATSYDGIGGWGKVIKLLRSRGAEEPPETLHFGMPCSGPKCTGKGKFLDSPPWSVRLSPKPSDWITGTRYECCVCEMFNLCSECHDVYLSATGEGNFKSEGGKHDVRHEIRVLETRESLGREEELGNEMKEYAKNGPMAQLDLVHRVDAQDVELFS